jgi:Restriction endonuclease S subunits
MGRNNWIHKKIVDVCDVIMGQSPPGHSYNKAGKGIVFFQGKSDFGNFYPKPSTWCTLPKKIAEANDILISVRAPVGPTNLSNIQCCIGRGLAAIRYFVKDGHKFIFYYLRSIESEIANIGTGSTFSAISKSQIENSVFPLPPLPEQHRIVAKIEEMFTKLDAGVEALKKVKAELKRYRQAVLKYAFEGKLTEEWKKNIGTHGNAPIEPASVLLEKIKNNVGATLAVAQNKRAGASPAPTEKLPELPEKWVWTTVGEISGKIQYGTSEKANRDASGIPVLRMGNIQDGKLVFDDLKYFSKDWSQLTDFMLQDRDVLFNRTNSAELVGKTAVYKNFPPQAVFASYLIRVRVDKNLYDPDLLSSFINSYYGRKYIASVVSQQVGQANVNGTKLSLMPIPLPPLPEQHQIIAEIERRFSVADEIEKTVGACLQQAQRLRQSILKKAFEGKLVPQDPNDEPAEKLLERIKNEKLNQAKGRKIIRDRRKRHEPKT